MKVLYHSKGTQRYFVIDETQGEEPRERSIFQKGFLVDLRYGGSVHPLRFGSILNHCPYEDWHFYDSGKAEDKEQDIIEAAMRER